MSIITTSFRQHSHNFDHGLNRKYWVGTLAAIGACLTIGVRHGRSDEAKGGQKPGTVITNSIGMKLARIPAGEFLMGSPDGDEQIDDDERPQHRVRITKPFYLGIYIVTQAEWTSVMGTTPWKGKKWVKEGDRFPAIYVSWRDATKFCRRLTERERRADRLGTDESYRLPTEAEWEYACRAGSTTLYHFGDAEGSLGEYAWYAANASDVFERYAHEVGRKRPNAWGLFDMHGNVWEWCGDWYEQAYYRASPETDPQGPSKGWLRTLRGGCWIFVASASRSAIRFGFVPSDRLNDLGFRVARGSPLPRIPIPQEKPEPAESAPAEKPVPVITNSIGMRLELIPAGEFVMGSKDTVEESMKEYSLVRDYFGAEHPRHRVRITRPFRLGVYEVTQAEWTAVMGTKPWKDQIHEKEGHRYAATFVSWEDATEFCRKLTMKERAAGRLEAGESYRLPTEAEWEYACRAGSTTRYYFGNDKGALGEYAWYNKNASYIDEKHAHAVGLKRANAWGLFDMHGNVSEWCSDWGHEEYYGQSPGADPRGPSEGLYKAIRGGSWFFGAKSCRSADRNGDPPEYAFSSIGFRVARSSDPSK